MIDVSLHIEKLNALQRFICNRVDGVETLPLADILYAVDVDYQMGKINQDKEKQNSRLVFITDHAFMRAKERLGVNRSAFIKMAENAFKVGVKHSDTVGNLKRYIGKQFLKEMSAGNIRIFGEAIFFFKKDVLATVYQIPANLKKSANNAFKEKNTNPKHINKK